MSKRARKNPLHHAGTMVLSAAIGVGLGHSAPVMAGPVNGSGTAGVVIQDLGGGQWVITAPDGSIINYTQFDLAGNEWVHFDQGSSTARVLNRVSGTFGPSQIYGTITGDGIVYFVNPAGVVFGQGSVVDVGGLYAAAGNISDANFLAKNDLFTNLNGTVTVENGASIQAQRIHLLGEAVANHGLLDASGGVLTMVAGDQIRLYEIGTRLIVEVDGSQISDPNSPFAGSSAPDMAATPAVENTGTIRVGNGRAIFGAGDMTSLAFRNTGLIEAAGGEINIAAKDGLVQNDGTITASRTNGTGGTVTFHAPSILNRGTIKADAGNGQAGSVELAAANHLYLTDGSVVSAAGGAGSAAGGTVTLSTTLGQMIVANGALIDISGGATGGNGGTGNVLGPAIVFNGEVKYDTASGYAPAQLMLMPSSVFINAIGGDDALISGDGMIAFGENGGSNTFIAASTLEGLVGVITIQATGDIYVQEAINFQNAPDFVLEAMRNIFIFASINGANDMTFAADTDGSGDGFVTLAAPISMMGDFLLSGTNVDMREAITTGGTQTFNAFTWIGKDVTLSGSRVTFNGKIDSRSIFGPLPALTIDGDAEFNDTVGADFQLASLMVTGTTDMNGSLVNTRDGQTYMGDLFLGSDAELRSTDGGAITFGGAVDGARDLTVNTAGVTDFQSTVGATTALSSVTTDAAGSVRFGSTITAGSATFNDAAELTGDVTIDANDVTFGSTIAGNANDLTVNATNTAFNGDATDLGALTTDAAGTTTINDASIAATSVTLGDDVAVTGTVDVRGDDFVDFGGTVDGAAALTATSDGSVRFGDDVGGTTALDSLTVEAGGDAVDFNTIVFDGTLVRANGDIRLNENGRSGPSQVATIAGRGDGLTIESLGGDIIMGQNEKLTSLGDLNLLARMGSATLGDLNANGDLTVDALDIALWTRSGGQILNSDGTFALDTGADIVAGGSIDFSVAPTLLGGGAAPIFAAGSGASISNSLDGQTIRRFRTTLGTSQFTFGSLVLDLQPPAFEQDNGRERAFEVGRSQFEPRADIEPFALRALDDMQIFLRPMSNRELLSTTTGRALYEDQQGTSLVRGQLATTANRLRRENVIRAVDSHNAIFGSDRANDDAIRANLDAAWADFQRLDPTGDFRQFVAASGETHAGTRATLDAIQGLMGDLRTMGLAPRELRRAIDAVLIRIKPEDMDLAYLEQAVLATRVN